MTKTRSLPVPIALILVVFALGLPFLSQAFHIDDRIYLEIAENALEQPLFPYDYPTRFEGLVAPDAASHSHLPFTSYYLACLKLVGGSQKEWVYHLGFLLFPLLLAIGFYDLAGRYTRFPFTATCLLLSGPAVMVLSHTLMTEIPLLAFWVLAVSRFVRLVEGPVRRVDWCVCALSVLAASFISLVSAGLILLLAAFLLVYRKERRSEGPAESILTSLLKKENRVFLLILLLPVLLWVVWFLRAYVHYDRFVLLRTFQHMDKRTVLSSTLVGGKLLSLLLNLGGIFVFPLALWFGFCRRRTGLIALLAGIASGLILAWQGVDWRGAELALFVLMFSSGALALMAVFRELDLPQRIRDLRGLGDKGQSSKEWLLLLWFSGIVFSCLLLYPSGSVRYVILLAPPLVLVWGMSLDRLVANPYFCRNLAGLAACLTCLLGLTISYADFKLAGTYRTFAREIIEEYQAENRTVWFAGEWGLRYYLESLGGKLLLRNSVEASPGDIIVKPYIASPWVTLYDGDKYTRLLEQREAPQGFPIRILDFFSHAGFYSTGWGILPFSWARSGERWEWINVFEVTNPYDGPIPESEKHW